MNKKFRIINFLLIVMLLQLQACKTSNEKEPVLDDPSSDEGFVDIFNGKDLEGWEGDSTYWSVENGNMVGQVTPSTPLENNTFLIWQGGQPDDFELKGEFRISESGNSGINYRSSEVENVDYALKGYQADIDGRNNYTGQNYEERARTTLGYRGEKVEVNNPENATEALQNGVQNNAWTHRTVVESLGQADSLGGLINKEDWNTLHLVVNGNTMRHYVNGVLMSDVTDSDTVNRKRSGYLGIQVHVGPPMKVEFRNLTLKDI